MEKGKSKCCNAEMIEVGDVTKYYHCTKCDNPCDIKPQEPEKGDWEKEFVKRFCYANSEGLWRDLKASEVIKFIHEQIANAVEEFDRKVFNEEACTSDLADFKTIVIKNRKQALDKFKNKGGKSD
jgi:hypothetical protein